MLKIEICVQVSVFRMRVSIFLSGIFDECSTLLLILDPSLVFAAIAAVCV